MMKRNNASWMIALVVLLFASLACSLTGGEETAPSVSGGGDAEAPVIQGLTVSAQTLYYGETSCGPTTLNLSLKAWDNSGAPPTVGLQYRLADGAVSGGGNLAWQQAFFTAAADGTFSLSLDVGALAQAQLNGQSGVLWYQVYAMDEAGNVQTEPVQTVYTLNVVPCVNGQAAAVGNANGAPAAPPAPVGGSAPASAGQGDTQPPVFEDAYDDGAVFSAPSCGYTTVTLYAIVRDSGSGLGRIYVRYRFYNTDTGQSTQWATRDMRFNEGGYSISFDVYAEAGSFFNGSAGSLEYQIIAVDKQGNQAVWPSSGPAAVASVLACRSSSGGSSGGGSPEPVSISNVSTYPGVVYYGVCSNGEDTQAYIQASIGPEDQVAAATVYYGYTQTAPGATTFVNTQPMYIMGLGDYAADINVGADLYGWLTGSGWLEMYIEVTDTQGQRITSSVYTIPFEECQSVAVSQPPVINWFDGPAYPLQPGDSYTLSWDTSNATCGVYLDGNWVEASGQMTLYVDAAAGAGSRTHLLVAQGGDCNNPTDATADVTVVIEVEPTYNSGSVTIYNNNSADLGDGGWDDVIYSIENGTDTLTGLGGALLAVVSSADYPSCRNAIASYGDNVVYFSVHDWICFQTREGNYGYLQVTGKTIDITNSDNTYIGVSYWVEIQP